MSRDNSGCDEAAPNPTASRRPPQSWQAATSSPVDPSYRWTDEGFVVDVFCLRRWLPDQQLERAVRHRTACALADRCIEIGYALVGVDGVVRLLDSHAAALVVQRLLEVDAASGVYLRAVREVQDGEAVTIRLEDAAPPGRHRTAVGGNCHGT